MPNFLSAAAGVANSVRTSGTDGLFNPSGAAGAATAGLSTALASGNIAAGVGASLAPLGLGALGLTGLLGGVGSKPKALHTEFADESAQWTKPYGSSDIVFYLMRADQINNMTDRGNNFGGEQGDLRPAFNGQANSLTTDALAANVGGVEPGKIPGNVLGGPNSLLPRTQSVMNQVGVKNVLGRGNSTAVGPISNFDPLLSIPGAPDARTTPAVLISTLEENVRNGLGRTIPGQQFTPTNASGDFYWDEVADSAFNPNGRSPFEVPTSELSVALSNATGGINSSDYLLDAGKKGEALFTTPSSFGSPVLDFGTGVDAGSLLGGSIGTQTTIPSEIYFITAPQEVSWDKAGNVKETATYGTNSPYLTYSGTSMRRLSLGNTMFEGFSDAKNVESNITALEACMKVVIDSQTGSASPYCWRLFAGNKCYGTFLITSIKVDERMRDMAGKATRAFCDIELMEVPQYQVSLGNVDIATEGNIANPSGALENLRQAQIQDQKVEDANKRPRDAKGRFV